MLDFSIQKAFFDSVKVQKALDAKTKRVFIRVGGRVRKTAQFSMRSRKESAKPPNPPHAHKKLLKKHIYFSYDEQKKEVVIGPILIRSKVDSPVKVTKLLEKGGHRFKFKQKEGGFVKQVYAGNPYMGPAFLKSKGFIAEQYKIGGLA